MRHAPETHRANPTPKTSPSLRTSRCPMTPTGRQGTELSSAHIAARRSNAHSGALLRITGAIRSESSATNTGQRGNRKTRVLRAINQSGAGHWSPRSAARSAGIEPRGGMQPAYSALGVVSCNLRVVDTGGIGMSRYANHTKFFCGVTEQGSAIWRVRVRRRSSPPYLVEFVTEFLIIEFKPQDLPQS